MIEIAKKDLARLEKAVRDEWSTQEHANRVLSGAYGRDVDSASKARGVPALKLKYMDSGAALFLRNNDFAEFLDKGSHLMVNDGADVAKDLKTFVTNSDECLKDGISYKTRYEDW